MIGESSRGKPSFLKADNSDSREQGRRRFLTCISYYSKKTSASTLSVTMRGYRSKMDSERRSRSISGWTPADHPKITLAAVILLLVFGGYLSTRYDPPPSSALEAPLIHFPENGHSSTCKLFFHRPTLIPSAHLPMTEFAPEFFRHSKTLDSIPYKMTIGSLVEALPRC